MASQKICVVIVSGTRERLQMAAMVASVAAVSGHEVVVFLSMNALPFFVKDQSEPPPNEGVMGRLMEGKNIPAFKTLLEHAAALGDARILPCSMAMDVLGIEPQTLEPFVGEATGLTKFLDEAQDGQVWTF
ncbi:MAG: DsrE/DsrF/DrsH-like family protein [Sterolibacterium sp.]|nr:DsrE/DsrF/DrsH-like family protein [Sterolibacterium sp.]